MDKDLFTLMNEQMNSFSKGHKAIAAYITEHYDKAAYMTAQKLGKTVGVSESTVVRFASMLGFDGYPALQRALQELMRNKLTAVQRIEVTNDRLSGGDVLGQVLASDIEKIRTTLEETSEDAFTNAVQAIEHCETVYILGARSAEPLASFLNYYLSRMFPQVKQLRNTTTSELFEQVMRIGEKDVMIGISFPRYSRQTARMMEFAKNQKAHVIALTDSEQSPLAPFADDLLIARSDMNSFADSLVAPLSLINALIAALSISSADTVRQSFEKLEKIWDEYEVYSENKR
ncbi:transcriptional regulator, RpiR family [Ruminococcus sp. YE71]|uniref:MurR/RpiR family transcriptional regulator n=1 Tax=unclassified Ruminococcus TaxID=2608920 RepID=UPI00087E47BA|nr:MULTISPECIES: MurR/RpiR family transcriptional regulator [unclassified Ruminococcus]SDA27776.1 transcriptional regulator, RpiR family [Ruminococcus sp. YE78]SFW46165.1 transcriptional regulator, RpiR family [Ruminococcus sp. YE71]